MCVSFEHGFHGEKLSFGAHLQPLVFFSLCHNFFYSVFHCLYFYFTRFQYFYRNNSEKYKPVDEQWKWNYFLFNLSIAVWVVFFLCQIIKVPHFNFLQCGTQREEFVETYELLEVISTPLHPFILAFFRGSDHRNSRLRRELQTSATPATFHNYSWAIQRHPREDGICHLFSRFWVYCQLSSHLDLPGKPPKRDI